MVQPAMASVQMDSLYASSVQADILIQLILISKCATMILMRVCSPSTMDTVGINDKGQQAKEKDNIRDCN